MKIIAEAGVNHNGNLQMPQTCRHQKWQVQIS